MAFAAICAGYLISIVNDFRLLRGSWLLSVALTGRFLTLVVTVVAAVLVLRAKRPKQHDHAFAWWVIGTAAINVVVTLTRLPLGEYQGLLFTANGIIGVYYFAMRGPHWPRLVGAATYLTSTMVLIWSPTTGVGPAFRFSSGLVLLVWTVMGILAARASDLQRRQQFRAERHERRLRQELAVRLRELAVEKERAEEMTRVRTAFLAVMSHEFRTPMNAVIGLSDLLLDQQRTPENTAQVQIIGDSARSLLTILNDILDFTKIDTQKLSLSCVPFDLSRLATSVVELLRPTAAGHSLDLSLELAPELPPCVLGDDVRLRQVLVNLVSNAIKFTESGSVRLQLTAHSAPDSDTEYDITIRVADTGIGIAPETLPRLFRPFQQADEGTTRRYGGTGLGLNISRQIVLAMGGDIAVASEPGRGSVFSFTLRLPAAAAQPEPVPPLPAPGPGSWRALSILVVDDQPLNQQVAQAKLTRLGHRVELANDGQHAISAVASKAYDVVFMDLQMPGMSGIEATEQIMALGQRAPHVIALTASVFEEDRAVCRKAGMRDFICKPIENARLEEVLAAVAAERIAMGPSPEPTPTLSPEGWAKLQQIEQRGAPDFVAKLIQIFLTDTHKRLPAMLDALARGDAAALEREAHILRSASATLGATGMSALCEKIERATHQSLLSDVGEWLAALSQQFLRVEQALLQTSDPIRYP